jgi:NAD(P)-dependent dehydrogenase (short-subunit alcohol dehydrogenase family)
LYSALAEAKKARVVAVSSNGHLLSPGIFDDLHFKFRLYNPWVAYGQSKTAVILFSVAANKLWASDGIATNQQRHVGGVLKTPPDLQKTPAQGAATSVILATAPALKGTGGHYFENCNEAETVSKRPADYHGVVLFARVKNNSDRLWATSMDLLNAKR